MYWQLGGENTLWSVFASDLTFAWASKAEIWNFLLACGDF